jgi:hypothetical protein
MKLCAFCPNEAVERGGEHIFDDWINRSITVTKHIFRYYDTAGARREYEKKIVDEKLPVLCHDCNSRWMSQITNRIKAGFECTIVDGDSLCILPSGSTLLAAFLFMKAAVTATHIAGDKEAFFNRVDREYLRISLTVPLNGVRMWVGAFQGEALHNGRSICTVLSSDAPPLQGIEYFTYTYLFGHLLLQLLTVRWKDVRRRGLGPLPLLRPDVFWDSACIQFWPPPKHFTDSSLQDFVERFQLPINIPRS